MQIQRDYSQPFFGSQRRRRRGRGRLTFLLLLLVMGAAGLVYTQYDTLQRTGLAIAGMAPQPTMMPSQLATEAMNAYMLGDLDEAVSLFDQALAQRPQDTAFLYEFGMILIEAAEYPRAMEFGDRMIRINSFDPRGYELKAQALVWSGDSSAAVPVVLSGMEIDRQHAPLYAILARAYVNIGNVASGLENAERAIDLNPDDAEARRSYAYALNSAAAHERATEQLEIALSLDPANIQIYMELAGQYLWRDRDDEAIDLYNQVLALQPQNARAMLRLCNAYRKTGKFDQALSQCEDAARTDPSFTAAQFQLGLILYSNPYRDFAGARAAFETCMESDPGNLECKYRLGLSNFYLFLDSGDPALCDSAWTILQDSLLMAQDPAVAQATRDNIRLGLSAVSRDCAAYSGQAPPVGDLLPEPTPELPADVAPEQAPDQPDTIPADNLDT